jgi:hypothetical protein
MRNTLTSSSVFKKLFKLSYRLILWILLVSVAALCALIVLGYSGASKPVSYLPQSGTGGLHPNGDTTTKAEIKSFAGIVSVLGNGEVYLKAADGEGIMSGLVYYSSYDGLSEKWGLDKTLVGKTSDSTISITGEGSSGSSVSINITVPANRARINVDITTRYNSKALVKRESLLATFDVAADQVYRKNIQCDTAAFDGEYWLHREGVRFGRGARSALIYHTPDISSLQLDAKSNKLWVNLEYSADHPFLNIPYQKDGGGRWTDLSEAEYSAGDTRKNGFSITFGRIPVAVPRIMSVPDGYLAGYVFTEHADGGNIKTHRAAYFGSEDITRIDQATGGFAGYKIPVTKSIFFPDIEAVGDSSSGNESEKARVLDFMLQLNATGNYDICLHGANSNRKTVEEWIGFMKLHFGTTTWIDHGMFSGSGNRQSFVCDGLNQESEFYTADIWEKYKTQYFWNASVEEFIKLPLKENIFKMKIYEAALNLWRKSFSPEELTQKGFFISVKELFKRSGEKGELNSFLPHRGNAYPTPLYWQHQTRTSGFYSWATDYVGTFSHTGEGVKEEEAKLDKLISERGIFINHGYFVRNLSEDGVLIKVDGKLTASPYFNQTLDIMAHMYNRGDLYLTTIRDLIGYWILAENISFDYMPDGVIIIRNVNDKPIKGFSLAVKANNPRINGVIPKSRRSGDETIMWFDIPAGESVALQTD